MSIPLARYSLRPAAVSGGLGRVSRHPPRRDLRTAPAGATYDENDADEFKPGNHPHVLLFDGDIVGTVRIDLIDNVQAGLRLIGIRQGSQRQGHGAALLRLAEQRRQSFGRTKSSSTRIRPR